MLELGWEFGLDVLLITLPIGIKGEKEHKIYSSNKMVRDGSWVERFISFVH